MSYVIIADSRYNKGQKVVFVDRNKSTKRWWSNFIDDAIIFDDLNAALWQKNQLKYNNPVVCEFIQAKKLLRGQNE